MDLVPVAKTEPIVDETNPVFEEIKEKIQVITGGGKKSDKSILRFAIKCWDDDTGIHKTYGSFITQIDYLKEHHQDEFPLYNEKGKKTGQSLSFSSFKITEQPSFAEYLKSGWYINMSVAIDFTASNGETSDEKSYHHLSETNPDHKNEYEIAMYHVGKILDTYAYKHKFMAYGFGGKPKGKDEVSHCFPLNGNEDDASISGLEKMMTTYKESL